MFRVREDPLLPNYNARSNNEEYAQILSDLTPSKHPVAEKNPEQQRGPLDLADLPEDN